MVGVQPVNVPKPTSKGLRVQDLERGKTYGLTSYHMGYRSYRRYTSIFNGLTGLFSAKFIEYTENGNAISQTLQVKGNYLVERTTTRYGFARESPSSTRDWKVVVTAIQR